MHSWPKLFGQRVVATVAGASQGKLGPQEYSGLTYQALKEKQVDIALAFATDGRIPAFDFVVLRDDKGFFPFYNLTPVIRKSSMDANPKIAPLLNALSAKLDDATMARLNASVDVDKKTIEEVATKFLKDSGLL
jgi:osmoprotectant transport system substrate-binding protein